MVAIQLESCYWPLYPSVIWKPQLQFSVTEEALLFILRMRVKNAFVALKVSAVLVCLALFLLLMKDVWDKYSTKMTSMGTQV